MQDWQEEGSISVVGLLNEVKFRKYQSQHVISQLRIRNTVCMSPAQWYHYLKGLYTIIVPNHSENKIKVPDGCYLRKFCPDGHHLLAFSQDQRSVEIFNYNGACAAQHLYDTHHHHVNDTLLSESLFNTFFKHKFSVTVSSSNEVLNRECSIFLTEDNYVIVASSASLPDDPFPHMYDTFRNNESLSPHIRFTLEDYTIFLISLTGGCVTDSYEFRCDKIFLSHNQGLSLCGSKLAVLSVQHQSIHLFEIISGTFIPLQEIGRFCFADDSLIFDSAGLTQQTCTAEPGYYNNYQPFLEKWINSLKHRFLCCIKGQAEAACSSSNKTPLETFYKRFDYFNSLRIWKMQLIDQHTLLLKYATEDIVTLRIMDPISQPAFFAFYDINSTCMLAVYENSSEDFLKVYERHADVFRSAVSHPCLCNNSCVSNCLYGRLLHMKFKQTITNAKYGGVTEATKRLLVQVPVCSQSFSCSPYLDLSLYRYDDKWISPLERPKPCGDAPIR